jgi:hypothetical protein
MVVRKQKILIKSLYHTYPDANDKGVLTKSSSPNIRQIDKSKLETSIDKKFKMDKVFPGLVLNRDPSSRIESETICTTLSNGLRVVSEDRYSLMTSISFVVKAGR